MIEGTITCTILVIVVLISTDFIVTNYITSSCFHRKDGMLRKKHQQVHKIQWMLVNHNVSLLVEQCDGIQPNKSTVD